MTPLEFLRFGACALLLVGLLAVVGTFVFALFMFSLNIYRNSAQAELQRQRERRSIDPHQFPVPSYPTTLNDHTPPATPSFGLPPFLNQPEPIPDYASYYPNPLQALHGNPR